VEEEEEKEKEKNEPKWDRPEHARPFVWIGTGCRRLLEAKKNSASKPGGDGYGVVFRAHGVGTRALWNLSGIFFSLSLYI
jgi:hypothetical protein